MNLGRTQSWYSSCAPDYLDGEEDEAEDRRRREEAEADRADFLLDERRERESE